jgi:type I restriction enzyme R subunit
MPTGGALRLNEDTLVEQPALAWLEELGWEHAHGSELSPTAAAAERTDYGEVLLARRLRHAVKRLNPQLPADAVDSVFGVPVQWTDKNGEERSERAKLVDFENPEKNEYLAVNQSTVLQGSGAGQKNRRPDVLLFINGMPLGQLNPVLHGGVSEVVRKKDGV